MRHILSKESIVLALSAALLTGCGCSSDEPQEVELILPSKYTQQDGTKVAHQIQAPLSTQAETTTPSKTEPKQQQTVQTTSQPVQKNTQTSTQSLPKNTAQKSESTKSTALRKAIVINVASNDTLNMRSGAGTKFKIVEKLSPGAIIMATQEYTKPSDSKHQWIKIISTTGKAGWVNTHYLKIQK